MQQQAKKFLSSGPDGPALDATPPERRRPGRPRKLQSPQLLEEPTAPPEILNSHKPTPLPTALNLDEKTKDLLRLAREQGHLTYEDLHDALPQDIATPEELDQVLSKLRNLEIEIIDAAEVERGRKTEVDEEETSDRFDILDDPVRMYLRQMGKVPLLNREQEVQICKRIEEADQETRR